VSSDSRERFTGAAGLYDLYRPTYPGALVDWILESPGLAPGAVVADVGCGTGISTRLFADRGLAVVGIDPNAAMLEKARATGGGARYQRGEAAATGLADGSVDLVTVAQAFHWFDLPAALAEFGRILRPNGPCAVFWNVRKLAAGFMDDYDQALVRFSSEYHVVESHAKTAERIKQTPGLADLREGVFEHAQALDHAGFVGLAWSSSYVLHGVADRAGFDSALESIFERHQQAGQVAFLYRTIALRFRLAR
jgi:ubiquinone/menaquinone biosynthesis C-methylase UbiE